MDEIRAADVAIVNLEMLFHEASWTAPPEIEAFYAEPRPQKKRSGDLDDDISF